MAAALAAACPPPRRSAAVPAAAPAVISDLAVAGDLAARRLIEIAAPKLDLRRILRAIWDSTPEPPPSAARDLISHSLTRRRGAGAGHEG